MVAIDSSVSHAVWCDGRTADLATTLISRTPSKSKDHHRVGSHSSHIHHYLVSLSLTLSFHLPNSLFLPPSIPLYPPLSLSPLLPQPRCGLPINPYFSALKLCWLMENSEPVRTAIAEGNCLFGTVDTWIIWVLLQYIARTCTSHFIHVHVQIHDIVHNYSDYFHCTALLVLLKCPSSLPPSLPLYCPPSLFTALPPSLLPFLPQNLTGGINGGVHVTDVTNASRTMLMNIHTLQWDPELYQCVPYTQYIYIYICVHYNNTVSIIGVHTSLVCTMLIHTDIVHCMYIYKYRTLIQRLHFIQCCTVHCISCAAGFLVFLRTSYQSLRARQKSTERL